VLTDLLDAWPSSAAFDLISDALSDEAERKDAIKKGGAIFAFTLKNDKSEEHSWYIDLKETGKLGKGTAPDGKKANGRCILPLDTFDGEKNSMAWMLCLGH